MKALPSCICIDPGGCGGLGMRQCAGCGGDLCICRCGGEWECDGCEECDDGMLDPADIGPEPEWEDGP